MKAEKLLGDRLSAPDGSFVDVRVWRVSQPVRGSAHVFKYSLALVIQDRCVLRYDNEAGKGDHRHVGDFETPYRFTTIEQLILDFETDVEEARTRWKR